VVLLNAGLIHRVGPFRMSVHMARRLAEQGHDVLRFDMPRVGDGAGDGAQSIEAGIIAALDAVERTTGSRSFAIGGICNGADMAWRIAQLDDRVTGLLLFDGFAERGPWFRMGRLRKAIARPLRQWPGLAMKLVKRMQPRAGGMKMQSFRDWPEAAQFREQAAMLLGRGVKILAMYTGGVSKYLLHRRQIDTTFGPARRHDGLDVEFWPEIDHILLSPIDRDRVMGRVGAWCATF
jgi:pimeloyl-ACP methyl ester carboxylesterase